ncbi:MAG: hypothetical protein RSG77_09810 [Hafnia sp.]
MSEFLGMLRDVIGDDPRLGVLFQSFAETQSEKRLGFALPDILANEEGSKQIWLQLLGGEKGVRQQLKELLLATNAASKIIKVSGTMPVDNVLDLLRRFFELPSFRNATSDDSPGRKSFSEAMLSRLLNFDEYKNYTLEMAENDLDGVLFSERGDLFTGRFSFFSKLATFPPMEDKVVIRMLRLSKLESFFSDFESLPQKRKCDLVLGLYGLFDILDCPLAFVELLVAFEALIPCYSDVGCVKSIVGSLEDGDFNVYMIQLLTDQVLNSDGITHYQGLQFLMDFEDYLKATELQANSAFDDCMARYNKLLAKYRGHLVPGEELALVDKDQISSGLKIADIRYAIHDLVTVGRKLSSIVNHPFIGSILKKDDEKHTIADALKALDPTNLAAAMELVERVKRLCTSVTDAPDELKDEIQEFVVLYGRFKAKYMVESEGPIGDDPVVMDAASNGDLEVVEVQGTHDLDLHKAQLLELQEELKRARFELAGVTAENEQLCSKNETLTDKVREQKTELGRFKAIQHALHTPEVNKPLQFNEGFVKQVADCVTNGIKTPEDMLRVFSILYSDRLVILDSAYESAKESSEFKNLERLGRSINILATDYLNDLMNGIPDSQARLLFGSKAFRAAESDSVLASDKMRISREFIYNGEKRVFERNIAIGIRYGAVNSLRMYFDVIDNKVVIAYCGQHLGNTKTT